MVSTGNLAPLAQRGSLGADLPFHRLADGFAVGIGAGFYRLAKYDRGPQTTPPQKLLEVRPQVHIAMPGDHLPVKAPDRLALNFVINHGHRLHPGARLVEGQGKKGRRKGANAVAIRRCAFREQDDAISCPQSLLQHALLLRDSLTVAGYKNRPPQFRDNADSRPMRDLGLGDKASGQDAPERDDIKPGTMISDKQRWPLPRGLTFDRQFQPDKPSDPTPVNARKPHLALTRKR